MCTHTNMEKYKHIQARAYLLIYIPTCIYPYSICTYLHVYIQIIHNCISMGAIYVHTYIHTHIYSHACLPKYMYTYCMYTYTCILHACK